MLTISFHPLLSCRVFTTKFPAMLGALVPSRALVAACTPEGPAPVHGSETVRAAVRELLRHSGFKPTGRSKPSSEYLAKVAADGGFPAINVAVDAGNAVSLHSGLPISVIDLARSRPPFHVAPAAPGTNYVFNRSG